MTKVYLDTPQLIPEMWTMCVGLMALVTVVMQVVSAQSRGSNVLRQGESRDVNSEIVTSRTRAYLSCESGDMVVKVNFTFPFRGLMYAHRSRASPCRVHGSGETYYELRIPLKGCGTWQESPRVFMNNITIRFHPALELEEDETKTVVCRYPPPLTPPPSHLDVAPITSSPSKPTTVNTARLSEVEILIIICVLLFLSLLTLGIGIAYFCLKKRNIRVVRRRKTVSSGPGSEVTKVSGTTLGNLSLFDPIRIPRAIPYSASGSEAALLTSRTSGSGDRSDTGPSEYPSESSPSSGSSELDEIDGRSGREESRTFAPKAVYDNLAFLEGSGSVMTIPKAILRKDAKRRTLPVLSVAKGHLDATSQREVEDQTVTTVLEPEEVIHWQSWNRNYAFVRPETAPSATSHQTPVYAQVKKKPRVRIIEDEEIVRRRAQDDGGRTRQPDTQMDFLSPSLDGAVQNRHVVTEVSSEVITEVTDTTTTTTTVVRQTKSHPSLLVPSLPTVIEQDTPPDDTDLASPRLSVHDIDDIYVTTTTETESRELVTTVSRDVEEQHAKSPAMWDVVIRQRAPPPPLPLSEGTESDSDDGVQESDDVTSIPRSQHADITAPFPPRWDVIIRAIPPPSLMQQDALTDPTDHNLGDETPEDATSDGIVSDPSAASPLPLSMQEEDANDLSAASPESNTSLIPSDVDSPSRQSDTNQRDDMISRDDLHTKESQARRVSWSEEAMLTSEHPESSSFLSSTDSFSSENSLGERSTSEVVEIAPTVRRRGSDHPMLERSTSEIETSPDAFSRWSQPPPVFESFSAQFIGSIPINRLPLEVMHRDEMRNPFAPIHVTSTVDPRDRDGEPTSGSYLQR